MVKEKVKKQSAKAGKEEKNEGTRKKVLAVPSRGRTFQGKVIRKFPKRITIEFERTVFIPKFERFMKKKTRIHARLPDEMANSVQIGDLVRVRECRPLSKIIKFLFVEKINSGEQNGS
jgi:small subunit ribosomal protein S17